MPKPLAEHDRKVTTLSLEQRDWIRRQGRLARALEAAQRESGRRFVRQTTTAGRARAGRRLNSP
jgi:predicted nucleic acid-binding Zn ribbon protein